MIELDKVIKRFDGIDNPVIDINHLNIKKGEFCTIIGANGSGKSTLLKLIAHEYQPDQGTVRTHARAVRVMQNVHKGTFDHLSVFENIVTSLLNYPSIALYERYRPTVLKQLAGIGMGLERFIDQPMRTLSGGQRQLIATLMAFNSEAPIILLDEHTAALDHTMQKLLMQYTERMIKENNKTALMVTHNMLDALDYGNRLIMLDQGQIVWDIGCIEKKSLTPQALLDGFTQRAYAGLKEA